MSVKWGLEMIPPSPEPTLSLAINLDAPCWLWTGSKDSHGYGKYGSKQIGAHRLMWTLMRGPIPPGMEIDHLCRVRHCVNPQHMEVVTRQENNRRGEGLAAQNTRKTHCKYGHPFDEVNTYMKDGTRQCHICLRRRWLASYYRIKARRSKIRP